MTPLPRKFKMRVNGSLVDYTVDNNGAVCHVTWESMIGGGATYNIDVAEKHVSNGTWLIQQEVVAAAETDEVPAVKDIAVGDIVEVVRKGQCYDYYSAWASKHGLIGFKEGGKPEDGDRYVVTVIAPHERDACGILYGVVGEEGESFIFAREGITPTGAAKSPAQTFNGFDADGNPKNFTEEDFAVFQRVELYNGEVFVVAQAVVPYHNVEIGSWICIRNGSWMDVRLTGSPDEWAIKSVYAPPKNVNLLDVAIKGGLLWTAEDVGRKQARAESLREELERATHNAVEWKERAERIAAELATI